MYVCVELPARSMVVWLAVAGLYERGSLVGTSPSQEVNVVRGWGGTRLCLNTDRADRGQWRTLLYFFCFPRRNRG